MKWNNAGLHVGPFNTTAAPGSSQLASDAEAAFAQDAGLLTSLDAQLADPAGQGQTWLAQQAPPGLDWMLPHQADGMRVPSDERQWQLPQHNLQAAGMMTADGAAGPLAGAHPMHAQLQQPSLGSLLDLLVPTQGTAMELLALQQQQQQPMAHAAALHAAAGAAPGSGLSLLEGVVAAGAAIPAGAGAAHGSGFSASPAPGLLPATAPARAQQGMSVEQQQRLLQQQYLHHQRHQQALQRQQVQRLYMQQQQQQRMLAATHAYEHGQAEALRADAGPEMAADAGSGMGTRSAAAAAERAQADEQAADGQQLLAASEAERRKLHAQRDAMQQHAMYLSLRLATAYRWVPLHRGGQGTWALPLLPRPLHPSAQPLSPRRPCPRGSS